MPSELQFHWYPDGTLASVRQENGKHTTELHPRTLSFEYTAEGLIESVTDAVGREWTYEYDQGRLSEARFPDLQLDATGNISGDHVESYHYQLTDLSASTPHTLDTGGQLDTVVDAEARIVLDVNPDPSKPAKIGKLCYGEICYGIDHSIEGQATVTGAAVGSGQPQITTAAWDEGGRLLRIIKGLDQTTQFAYIAGNRDPLVDAIDLPTEGLDEVINTWQVEVDASQPRRTWFNLRSATRNPDLEGEDNGAAALTTAYEYWGDTDLVSKTTLPGGGRVWTLDRDSRGALDGREDPEGRQTQFETDVLGRTISGKPAGNEDFATAYDFDDEITGCGALKSATPPADNLINGAPTDTSTTVVYDRYGFPKETRAPPSGVDHSVSISHRPSNQLGWTLESWTAVSGKKANHAKTSYDAAGRVVQTLQGSDSLGIKTVYQTTDAGLPKSETVTNEGGIAEESLTTHYGYGEPSGPANYTYPGESDGLLRLVYREPTGRASSFSYDELGRRTAQRVWNGTDWIETTTVFERRDDLPTAVIPPSGSDGHSYPIRYSYDRFGRAHQTQETLTSVEGDEGPEETNRYTTTTYDAWGRPVSTTVGDGNVIWAQEARTYNLSDQLKTNTSTRLCAGGLPCGFGAGDLVTTFVYDEAVDPRAPLTSIIDPGGHTTTFSYDKQGRKKSVTLADGTKVHTAYWPSGLSATSTEEPVGLGQTFTTQTEYDSAGRVKTVKPPGSPSNSRFYDDLGRIGGATDSAQHLTIVESSALGTVVETTSAGRATQTKTIDLQGLKATLAEEGGATFETVYNLVGRRITLSPPGGPTRRFSYFDDGSLEKETTEISGDPDPLIVMEKTYRYDASGRLETLGLSAPPTSPLDTTSWPETINYHYDLLSRVTSVDQSVAAGGVGASVSVERAYSSLGELTQERLVLDGTAFETNATYDDNGALAHLIYPDGTLYDVFERDPLSRMANLQVTSTSKAGPQTLWSAQYSGFRQTSGVQGALHLSQSFHDNGMPKDLLAAIGDPTFEYSGRYHLNRTYSDTLRFDTQFQATVAFTRDHLNHDLADRATDWDAARQNLPSLEALRIEEAPGDEASSETRRISFPQAGHDQLNSTTGVSNGVPVSDYFQISTEDYRIQGSGPTSFSFDALGNRAGKLQTPMVPEIYTHDWANRLSTITRGNPGDEVTTILRYDPSGRRVVQSESDGADTARIFWGQQVIAEYTKEADDHYQIRKRNFWSENLDHLIAFDADNDLDGFLSDDERFFTLTNPQGSVTGIALADGRLVESYAYRNDGTFTIYGEDLVPPELEYAAILPEDSMFGRAAPTLVLVFSEPVQAAHGTVSLTDADDAIVNGSWSKMEDPRIWWTDLDPALVAGAQYTLMVDSVEDFSGNQQHHDPVVFVGVAETELFEIPLGPAKAVGDAGLVSAVIDGPDEVVIVLTRPIDPNDVTPQIVTVTDNGTAVPGTIEAFRPTPEDRPSRRPFKSADERDERAEVPPFAFVLKWSPDNPAQFIVDPSGAHQYEVQVNLDSAKAADPIGFYHLGLGTLVEEYEPDSPVLTASQVGNDRFQHGRPWIRSAGLYDHRTRFYEPATMSFLEPDPLGPVDSPNLYQGFGFDGLNLVDPMGKGVYGIEGTGQDTVGTNHPSNVAIICDLANQRQPGSGFCLPGPGSSFPMKTLGGITGAGLQKTVESLYWRIVKNYNAGDKVIALYGFSRGATGIRHLGNILNERGIPDLSSARRVVIGWKLAQNEASPIHKTVYDRHFKVDIQFMGLFDTVASTGDPTNDEEYFNLSIPPNAEVVRQAIALHERRGLTFSLESAIDPDNPNDPRIVEEGFPGGHVDIGGGSTDGWNGDGGLLPDFSLVWMVQESRNAGCPLARASTPWRGVRDLVYHDMTRRKLYFVEKFRNQRYEERYGERLPRQVNYHNNPPVLPKLIACH